MHFNAGTSAGPPAYGDTNLSIAALLEKQVTEDEGEKPPESGGVWTGRVMAVKQGSSSRS